MKETLYNKMEEILFRVLKEAGMKEDEIKQFINGLKIREREKKISGNDWKKAYEILCGDGIRELVKKQVKNISNIYRNVRNDVLAYLEKGHTIAETILYGEKEFKYLGLDSKNAKSLIIGEIVFHEFFRETQPYEVVLSVKRIR